MFRTVRLSIIRILFSVHSAVVYVIQVCRQLSNRSICSCSTAVYKPVWHIPLLSVQWINSWWRTEELSETCRVSCKNKFVKLVHLVGCTKKKLVTMHGHMYVKFPAPCFVVRFQLCSNKRTSVQIYWHSVQQFGSKRRNTDYSKISLYPKRRHKGEWRYRSLILTLGIW